MAIAADRRRQPLRAHLLDENDLFASSPNPCSTGGANSTGTNTCGPVSSAIDLSRDGGATSTTSLDPGGRSRWEPWLLDPGPLSRSRLCGRTGPSLLRPLERLHHLVLVADAGAGVRRPGERGPSPAGPVPAHRSSFTNGPRPGQGIEGFLYATTTVVKAGRRARFSAFSDVRSSAPRRGTVGRRGAGPPHLPGHESRFPGACRDPLAATADGLGGRPGV